MKSPECYLGNDAEFEVFSFHEVIDMIAEAQKDAYNQAIQDAVKSAEIYVSKELPSGISLNESYYDNEWENYILVDKDSILKLKIK